MFGSKKKESEKVIMRVRNSRKIYFPVYAMVLVLIIVIIFIKLNNLPLSSIAVLCVILFIILGIKFTEIHRLNNLYVIDPIAFIHTEGIFNKRIKRGDYFAIRNVNIEQTAWQRMLNYGTVLIDMFSEIIPVRNINSPEEFAIVLENIAIDKRRGVATPK